MNNTPSAYQQGKTIGEIADEWAGGVRKRAGQGKGISHYGSQARIHGSQARIHLEFTLAGGGPGADVTIIGEGETIGGDSADLRTILGGHVTYYETGGRATVELGWQEAEDIYEALMRGNGESDEDEEDEHSDGDGCAVYDPAYRVILRDDDNADGDDEDDDPRTSVEDLEPGDYYRDPAHDAPGEWFLVNALATMDDDIHIDCTREGEEETE